MTYATQYTSAFTTSACTASVCNAHFKQQHPPRVKHQSGMLMIEVLLSILIFSFGILGLVGLQAISTKNALNAEDRTIASGLANDMISMMWIYKTTNVTAAPLITEYTAWQAKVTNMNNKGWQNAVGTVATDTATPPITTITITWKTAPTAGKNSGSTALVSHQYVTQLSM